MDNNESKSIPPTVCHRYTDEDDFTNLILLRVGMCITGRVNSDNAKLAADCDLPYPDFVYVVCKIKNNSVLLIDTAHNNSWDLDISVLSSCELVQEFHRNVDHVDCEYINRALTGFYDND